MKKSAPLFLLAAASVLTLSACGTKAPTSLGVYSISEYSEIAAMGWIIDTSYELEIYDDNTYTLMVRTDYFGGAAQGSELDEGQAYETKGVRTVVTTGTYTISMSADEYSTHQDVVLSKANTVYVAQYGKAWGRNTDIIGSTAMLDTTNWTSAMETIYGDTDDNGNALNNGKEKLLASDYAASRKCTISNPSLDAEDTTASYCLVTVPTIVA